MRKKKRSLLQIQLIFSGILLALFLLARYAAPSVYAALCEIYRDILDGPPVFAPDSVEQAARQIIAFLTEPR